MHRTTLCLRTYRHPRLVRILHSRHLRRFLNAGAGYQVDDDGNVIESLSSWEDHHAREVGRRPVDAPDVVIDDLSATLEAHRASNRASVIRKIDVSSSIPPLFLRPSIDGKHEGKEVPSEDVTEVRALAQDSLKSGVDGDQGEQTQEGNEAGIRIWPADSVQAQEGYGRRDPKRVRRKAGNEFVKSRGVLEYAGVPLLPIHSWDYRSSSTALLQRPWLAYMEESSGDHLERLSGEIRAYEAYMRLTPAEETAAQLVISDVKDITRKSLGKAPLTMLGSRSTGLATPLSDFDVTFSVTSSDHSIGDRKQSVFSRPLIRQAVGSLRKIEKDLRYSIKVQGTELVIARIPIIETKHRGTGFKIQIQTMAPHRPAQEYSAAYLNELPSLRPLFIVLRYCLEIRGLTKVYEGGLGSYSLLMMIVTALKHSSGTFAPDDLAGQLLYVLYFYGSADLYQHGFSANPPRVFDKLKEGWSMSERLARSQDPQLQGIDKMVRERNGRKPYLLSLQDPANDSNDLGKNSYAIKHIQAVFNNARRSILSALEQGTVPPEDHGKDGMWSYMDGLVRANYKAFEANRSRVERFAKNPVSKDYDYSTERTTEDFQRRVNVYKGLITEDFQRETSPDEQATPVRIGNSNPRQLGREMIAAEIAKAQETKHLTTSTANLEKRFRVLRAKTEHLRRERNTIAMERLIRSGRRSLMENLRKEDDLEITFVQIHELYAMLRHKFHNFQRAFLFIARRVARTNGEDSGVASMQLRYERLRRVKDKYLRDFNDITRRLSSLNGQDSATADTKNPLTERRKQLRMRVGELQEEISMMRERGFELGPLHKRNMTDADYSLAVTNLKESQRRRGEINSELRKIDAVLAKIRQESRIRNLENERGLKQAARYACSDTTSLDSETALVIDCPAAPRTNSNEDVQLQEAVEASASENDTAVNPMARLEDVYPQGRRHLEITCRERD